MKNITIRQIKAFESVARNLSFSRAAEDLHLTQPAVSMQIKQMEDQAGLPLFFHLGKRISLTEAGELMLRHTRVILADLKAAEKSFESLKVGDLQRLRVGLVTSGSSLFPHLISGFMQGKAWLDLDMNVRSRDQLIALLHTEQIDLAVVIHAPDDPRIVAEAFAPNPFILVCSPTHPLAHERDIPYSRIAAERLIVRESGTDTRSAADDIFSAYASPPRFMEIGCTEAIKQSVMAGMGISFLSAQAVQSELRAGLLNVLDVQGFPLKRHWCVVHRADRNLPPAALAFRQFLLTEGGARLEHFTGMDKVQMDIDLQRVEHVALDIGAIAASNGHHGVVLRTRALLRDHGLPDEHQVQSQNHAGSDDGGHDQPAAGGKSTHH